MDEHPLHSPIVDYSFECASLASSWRVVHFYCEQRVNHSYQGRLLLMSDPDSDDPSAMMGQRVSVHLARGPSMQSFGGIVQEVQALAPVHGHPLVALEFVPALALAKQNRNARVFQDQSALGLVQSVLEPTLLAYGSRLDQGQCERGQEILDFRVQYDESDFEFASRILAQAGINFVLRYDHDQEAETMVLFDRGSACPLARNIDASSIFAYHPISGHVGTETVQSFVMAQRWLSSATQGAHWDWTLPFCQVGREEGSSPLGELASFDPKQYRENAEGLHHRVRDQSLRRSGQTRIATGTSQALGLGLGCGFELTEHPIEELNGSYLLTGLVHEGTCLDLGLSMEDLRPWVQPGPRYQNRFTCLPDDTPLLADIPDRKTRVRGPMTAVVCGPTKGQVHVDDKGRIQLRFHWDLHSPPHQPGSCWVRVAQGWTGDGFGMNFIPRVGSEVLVEFLEGDPEQPVVTGSVPNRATPPPFALPKHKYQSGWVTRSSDGADGYNELRFDDQEGEEEVYLRAQKALNIEVLGVKVEQIQGDHVQSLASDDKLSVQGNRLVSIAGASQCEVHGPKLLQYHDSLIQDIGPNGSHVKVRGLQSTQAVDGFEIRSSKGGADVEFADKLQLTANSVEIKCGETTISVNKQGALSLVAQGQPISIKGSKIQLNS